MAGDCPSGGPQFHDSGDKPLRESASSAVDAAILLTPTGLTLAAFVVSARQVALPAPGGISLSYPNPLAVRALQPVTWLGTLNGLAPVFTLLLAPAVVSLVLRDRRGDQRLRQQMKWLGLAIAGVLVSIVVGSLRFGSMPAGRATGRGNAVRVCP